jgi:hypothetical protein
MASTVKRRGRPRNTHCSECGAPLTPKNRRGGKCLDCARKAAAKRQQEYHAKMMRTSGAYAEKMYRKKQVLRDSQRAFARARDGELTIRRAEVRQRKASKQQLRRYGFPVEP